MANKTTFIIELCPEPVGNDSLGRSPDYRLKLLLKRALRQLGLRALVVRDGEHGDHEVTAGTSGPEKAKAPNASTSGADE